MLALPLALLVASSPLAPQAPVPAPPPTTAAPAYDPLLLPPGDAPPTLALVAHDAARARDVPLRVYLPTSTAPAPVILWSHGLGGSRDNSGYLGRHWSARGYVVVFLQHAGSDESVWRDVAPRERMAAMQRAASGANLALRCGDVQFVLDQLAVWNGEAQPEPHALRGRLDLAHVGMCGHSFGAITTQAVSGQTMPVLGAKWTDARIDAALPMSPSKPRAGDAARAFGQVAIPWLLMTGTDDRSPIGDIDVEDRLAVYPALPATIDRAELVLDGAEHSVFGERALPGERRARKPSHHRSILALSTAFWDTHLRGDAAARAWLHGDGPRRVLDAADRWQAATATPRAAPAPAPEPAKR